MSIGKNSIVLKKQVFTNRLGFDIMSNTPGERNAPTTVSNSSFPAQNNIPNLKDVKSGKRRNVFYVAGS